MTDATAIDTTMKRLLVWITGVLGIGAIGLVDFMSGVELRVFPLYYLPISLLAWRFGRSGAVIGAALSAISWMGSNSLAGLQVSHPALWLANTLVQAISFATVGLLIATLENTLSRERRLSRTDPLTSLLNGRAFHEEGARILALCRRKSRPVTLAYIDLDDFKVVNDTLGHQAGDDLLRRVAALFRASTRPSDLCARLGGDEFAVLLPEVDAREAAVALERFRLLLSETALAETIRVTGSIGAVTFVTAPETLNDIIAAADARMYAAKAGGKNRIHLAIVDQAGPATAGA